MIKSRLAPRARRLERTLNEEESNMRQSKRHGAIAVEAAIVLPVMILLLLMLIVGGNGVFRYQQVACAAREAARWSSVRGNQYHLTTRNTCPTESEIVQNAVTPFMTGIDSSSVTVVIEWIDGNTGAATAWDSAKKSPIGLTNSNQAVNNRVRVTVTHRWTPAVLLPGTITMSSVSETPMTF
jgi:Flp pilus assembly protein TadG